MWTATFVRCNAFAAWFLYYARTRTRTHTASLFSKNLNFSIFSNRIYSFHIFLVLRSMYVVGSVRVMYVCVYVRACVQIWSYIFFYYFSPSLCVSLYKVHGVFLCVLFFNLLFFALWKKTYLWFCCCYCWCFFCLFYVIFPANFIFVFGLCLRKQKRTVCTQSIATVDLLYTFKTTTTTTSKSLIIIIVLYLCVCARARACILLTYK